jgi:hypothetical protein
MKRKTKSVICCVIFFIITGCSQSGRRAYTPPGGEFSYVPPERWVLRDLPGYKYKLATGQPSEGFAPNIGVVDEYAPVTLDDYVAGNLRVMPQMHEKKGGSPPRVLNRAEFTTDSNGRGVRVVTESETGGKKIMRQIFYFFDGKGGNKFVVTCSALGAARESYDKLCDTSIKTFKAGRA